MARIEYNYPLLSHNTFGIEAYADRFVAYDSVEDLRQVVRRLRADCPDVPVLHIGGGSNLLFLSDFKGVVLHSAIGGIECEEQPDGIRLRVGAAVVWDDLVAYCVEHGFYGLENLSFIPGEVGASAVQNIGAYGAEAKDVITAVETVGLRDGEVRMFDVSACGYAYRKSIFKEEWRGRYAVTHVHFRLSATFRPNLDYGGIREALSAEGIRPEEVTAQDLRRVVIAIRKAKLPDPKVQGNAGSFFMNPVVPREVYEAIKGDYPDVPHYEVDAERVKIPAGWLIERCGWKGRSLGRAAVHDRQALVLVNKGGATGRDILALCEAGRAVPLRHFHQPGSKHYRRMRMKITFLGTGTSTGVPQIGCSCKVCRSTDARDKRLRTSVLVETEQTRILLDCGPDFRQQILPLDFRRIDAVLLTHEHYDHVGGIDDLRPFGVFGDVQLYASERTGGQLRQSLPYCFVEHKYPGVPQLRLHAVRPHEAFRVGELQVTPIEVMHARLPILGYRVGRMAYITDMKTIADSELDYLQGLDLLILNGLRHEPHYSHQTIEEACAFARRLCVPRTYLIHMGHHIDLHAVEDARLPEGVRMAYDGLVVDVEGE